MFGLAWGTVLSLLALISDFVFGFVFERTYYMYLYAVMIVLWQVLIHFFRETPKNAVVFNEMMEDVASAYIWCVDEAKKVCKTENPKIFLMGHSGKFD